LVRNHHKFLSMRSLRSLRLIASARFRVNRRLEFELGAGFDGSCGFALVLALSQMREHGLGFFGRADLHPRRNPLDRQCRFAPQPGSAGPQPRSLRRRVAHSNSCQPRRANSSAMMRVALCSAVSRWSSPEWLSCSKEKYPLKRLPAHQDSGRVGCESGAGKH
jgi:hypothetical protein